VIGESFVEHGRSEAVASESTAGAAASECKASGCGARRRTGMLAALSGELLFQEQRGAKPLDTALQIALPLVLTNTSIVINTTSPIVQHKHKINVSGSSGNVQPAYRRPLISSCKSEEFFMASWCCSSHTKVMYSPNTFAGGLYLRLSRLIESPTPHLEDASRACVTSVAPCIGYQTSLASLLPASDDAPSQLDLAYM
jgi:hypothetical protein